MIKLNYKSNMPIHEQITEGLKELIILNVLKKDDQLPSVRDLSVELTVNPNTVQRAYKTLEQEGVIYSIRGKGNFVSDVPVADNKTMDGLMESLEKNLRELAFFGKSQSEVLEIVKKIYNERNELDD